MKNKSLLDSFHHALEGVLHTLRFERNFKIHFTCTFFVLLLAVYVDVDAREFLILCLTVTAVLVAELFNTSIEAIVDMLSGNRRTHLGKVAKDTAAGAVFLASVNAAIVGYIIIVRKLVDLDFRGVTMKTIQETPIYVTLICMIIVVMCTIILKAFTKAENYFKGGMPSAHTALAFSIATCILYFTESATAILLAYLMAVLVAQSRVEGKIHSLIQVVLGGLLGILCTAVIFQAFYIIRVG